MAHFDSLPAIGVTVSSDQPLIVPIETLQPETLAALVEEFVTRAGAVHGHSDASMDEKAAVVLRQLRAGSAVVVFDEDTASASIVLKDDLR